MIIMRIDIGEEPEVTTLTNMETQSWQRDMLHTLFLAFEAFFFNRNFETEVVHIIPPHLLEVSHLDMKQKHSLQSEDCL